MDQALSKNALVAAIGAGAMGAGIAQIAAQAGQPVRLLDLRPGAAEQAIERVRSTFGKLAEKGKLSVEAAAAAGERLSAAASHADLAGAALVVEAIVERLDVKRQLFAELEGIVAADCIFATNTSSISVTAIAAGLQHATIEMTIREHMLDGHDICHGGYITTLADSAFAYACNSYDELTVASGVSVDFIDPARLGDTLTASSHEVSKAGRTGVYDVEVSDQQGARIAVFRGRSHTFRGRPAVPRI
jgi:phenylacetic acid degradation protein PaaD